MHEIVPGPVETETSRPERARQTRSELADEDGPGSELYEFIYFDDAGNTYFNVSSSQRHEIQTAPLFTSSALRCIETMRNNGTTIINIKEY